MIAERRHREKRTAELRDQHLLVTARMYLKGATLREIGRENDVSPQTVMRDVAIIRELWFQRMAEDYDELVARELAKLDELERVAWEAWEASKTRESTTSGQTTGATATQFATLRRDESAGDATFLARVAWCIDRRVKLLGLDKYEKERAASGGGAGFALPQFHALIEAARAAGELDTDYRVIA